MPATGGTFTPNGRFMMPRSYVGAFVINVTAPIVQTDGLFELTDPLNPAGHFRIKVDDRFWSWSSNAWTLDYVIEESVYHYDPDPIWHDMPFALEYVTYGDDAIPVLKFFLFSIIFPDEHLFEMPAAPPTYWMPPLPT